MRYFLFVSLDFFFFFLHATRSVSQQPFRIKIFKELFFNSLKASLTCDGLVAKGINTFQKCQQLLQSILITCCSSGQEVPQNINEPCYPTEYEETFTFQEDHAHHKLFQVLAFKKTPQNNKTNRTTYPTAFS